MNDREALGQWVLADGVVAHLCFHAKARELANQWKVDVLWDGLSKIISIGCLGHREHKPRPGKLACRARCTKKTWRGSHMKSAC